MQQEEGRYQQPIGQQRTSSAAKAHTINSTSKRNQGTVEHQSLQSSKQKLVNLESSMTIVKDAKKGGSTSGKQNKSYVAAASKNSLGSSAQNQKLLNATLLAMIGSKPTKNNSSSKPMSGSKRSVSRAKSACKGKAELFNSTAPIKFFSNLEDTVREITGVNTTNLKMSSSKVRQQQTSQNRQKEAYSNAITAEDRKLLHGGTHKIQFSNRPPSSSTMQSKRRVGESSSKNHNLPIKSTTATAISYPSCSQIEQVDSTFNNPAISVPDFSGIGQHDTSNFINSSVVASFHQGDYSQPQQLAAHQSKSKTRILSQSIKTKIGPGVGQPQTNSNTGHNSKIKLRLNQQKTRSSSSISNTQKNLNSTQKTVSNANNNESRFTNTQTHILGIMGSETSKSGTHVKMSQALQQKGAAKMAVMKMTAVKSRQNAASSLSGFQSEAKNNQTTVVPFGNNITKPEKESKTNKSFQSTAASKKQRQTLKGMIEGLNATTTNTSIPGSSSKRKSSHCQYLANSMNIRKQRYSNNAGNYGAVQQQLGETTTSSLSKNKDNKIYASYNYKSNGSAANTQQSVQPVPPTGQHNGSKSSSSLSQLAKSKKALNNSLLLFNSTSKKLGIGSSAAAGNGNMLPQFARVDFDRLNNRKVGDASSKIRAEKQQLQQNNNELSMESYQDITKAAEQIGNLNQSQKGLSSSLQKAFLSNSNRLNMPKHSTTKSIEDSSSYFATCTASGPLNPFLEQILREIPNAYSGNVSGVNSAGATAALNLGGMTTKEMNFNLNIQNQSSNKAAGGSKKTLGKISKKIRSNMNIGTSQKDQISNTFNLTTTAAALLAASDKNAAAFMNIETKTFESRNSNSVSGIATRDQSNGVLNSSKKQNLNKTVETKISIADRKSALNQRVTESKGQIRLTSQKRSLKSSYSCSQKRQREAASKQSIKGENSAIYISESIRPDNKQHITNHDSLQAVKKTTHLSQTRLTGQQTQNRFGSLLNVVKVAAKQKESKTPSNQKQQPSGIARQQQKQFSLNTTQVLEEQLLQLKLAGNNMAIPQKTKVQSKSRGQLNSSAGNIQSTKLLAKKRSPTPQDNNVKAAATTNQPHGHYSNETNYKQKQTKKQLEMTVKLQHKRQELRGKTNEPQNRKSNQLKFDWSGFLSNLMHENFKPKKSTSGPGNANASALCEKPYQLQQDMQNKTQPLPKGLLRKEIHQHDAYDLQNKGGAVAKKAIGSMYGAPHLQKTESRGSEQRPRIGRKQIEIAPLSGAQTNFAATMTQNQLKGHTTTAAIQAITVLTEVTEPGETEKDSNRSAPSTHRTPNKVNEDYKFGRLLGQGAYAVVRLAYKKSEGKNYAAKIYDKSKLVDEHRRNSVCREVLLMQKLKHPYVVNFSEAFETDHHVYLIIEYVTGKSMHDYLKKQRASPTSKTEFDQTLSEEETKRLIKQLLQCLDYLHEEGITHRDIKLENILLDQDNNIKIIDFGFSTSYKPQRKLKMFCGTPSYMAPEIVSRVDYYGPPADIWATGVLLFCLLNGFFPFKGQTDAELYRKINRGAFKMIRSDLSDDCLNILKEMFNINADSRLTASELLQENWFLTDSTKKRSIAEIRREFKAKILKKFPVRSVKNTICIPAPAIGNLTVQNQEHQSDEESKDMLEMRRLSEQVAAVNRDRDLQIHQNNSLAQYRNFNQASPPSMAPPESQQMQLEIDGFNSQTNETVRDGEQSQRPPVATQPQNEDRINQEALLAYYNTSEVQVHAQASGPPSGKFTLTPYSAYNQWSGPHGSPPSMADINVQQPSEQSSNLSRQQQQQPNLNPNNQVSETGPHEANQDYLRALSQSYHPQPISSDPHKDDSQLVDAADVEIIIQGKPSQAPQIIKSNVYGDFAEYRDSLENTQIVIFSGKSSSSNLSNSGMNRVEQIYGMPTATNNVPANKQ